MKQKNVMALLRNHFILMILYLLYTHVRFFIFISRFLKIIYYSIQDLHNEYIKINPKYILNNIIVVNILASS